ncbi:YaaC family protein [Brevibacillus marinus]|uniref:YaaC family protein n=1 Tax=Brevibacillus marinus TaxID=2496837 RepID=UPI0013E0594F|nr:YaaC family protein [Brevibacillus marinus]
MRSAWDAWEQFRYLETEPATRRFLTERYACRGLDHPERLAYQQSHRFLYTCIQARTYYAQAAESSLLIQPLLLFYGCVNLLKALLITREPEYPQTSRMLQHGVTTRKIKKSAYQLLQDEVRPQKEGLFACLARALRLPVLQDRYTLEYLFCSLPELAGDYQRTGHAGCWQPVPAAVTESGVQLSFPPDKRGPLAFSAETLAAYLNRLAPASLRFFPVSENDSQIDPLAPPAGRASRAGESQVKQITVRDAQGNGLQQHPLLYAQSADRYLFWNGSAEQLPLPGWAAHYLLLYVLSMLCRYETEWWGELVLSRTMEEVYLVDRFLSIHRQWFPRYLYERLTGAETFFLKPPAP